jgi:transposase
MGLWREIRAVEAALTQSYSQGQIEVQITRLELLERAVSGGANCDPLRRQFLAPV